MMNTKSSERITRAAWGRSLAVVSFAAAALVAGTARAGTLAVTANAAMGSTTKGLEATITDTNPLYVEDDTPLGEAHYHAHFWFNPVNFDPGEAQGHLRSRVFIGFQGDANPRRIFAIVLRRQSGAYSMMMRTRQDDNTQNDSGFFPISAGAHLIEWDFTRAASASSNDGVTQFYIDGVLKNTTSNNDNNASLVDSVKMGAQAVKTGASGTMYWDEFASTR
jgi:hypothetical protein